MRIDIIILLIHLLVIAIIDYKQHIIPDQLIISMVVFKQIYSFFLNTLSDLLISIGYALLITVPLLLLTVWMEKKTGKFQLGEGDLKLVRRDSFIFLSAFSPVCLNHIIIMI